MRFIIDNKNISFMSFEFKNIFIHIGLYYSSWAWGKGEYWHDGLVFDFGLGPFFRIIKFF